MGDDSCRGLRWRDLESSSDKDVWPEKRLPCPPAASLLSIYPFCCSKRMKKKNNKKCCSLNFLPLKSQNQQCKSRHMSGKKSFQPLAPPPRSRKDVIVDVFLWGSVANLANPKQGHN